MARPIDGDALKKWCEKIIDQACHPATVQIGEVFLDKVRSMPTLTPQNEWVSVDERLPEPEFAGQQRGFYLVALSNGVVKELMYEFRHYENMMFDVGWHETAYPVTHWTPLPAPPDRRPPEGEA